MQLNVWGSDFFYLINKIPFNVGIKNRGRRQYGRHRVFKLVRAKLGSLGKVVACCSLALPPLFLWVSCRLPCNMTSSQRCVTPVNVVMFSGCQIRP